MATPKLPLERREAETSAAAAAPPRKPHIAVIGHLAGEHVFGAERSLLSILAAIDRTRYDLSCVLPSGSEAYLRAVREYAGEVIVFPYQWWTLTRPFNPAAVTRFA